MITVNTAASTASQRARRRTREVSFAADVVRIRSNHDPYKAANVCMRRGSLRSTSAAVGSAARINQGVSNVVSPETATAMEYKGTPSVAPVATPIPAIINENSPIWARLMPDFTAV